MRASAAALGAQRHDEAALAMRRSRRSVVRAATVRVPDGSMHVVRILDAGAVGAATREHESPRARVHVRLRQRLVRSRCGFGPRLEARAARACARSRWPRRAPVARRRAACAPAGPVERFARTAHAERSRRRRTPPRPTQQRRGDRFLWMATPRSAAGKGKRRSAPATARRDARDAARSRRSRARGRDQGVALRLAHRVRRRIFDSLGARGAGARAPSLPATSPNARWTSAAPRFARGDVRARLAPMRRRRRRACRRNGDVPPRPTTRADGERGRDDKPRARACSEGDVGVERCWQHAWTAPSGSWKHRHARARVPLDRLEPAVDAAVAGAAARARDSGA